MVMLEHRTGDLLLYAANFLEIMYVCTCMEAVCVSKNVIISSLMPKRLHRRRMEVFQN